MYHRRRCHDDGLRLLELRVQSNNEQEQLWILTNDHTREYSNVWPVKKDSIDVPNEYYLLVDCIVEYNTKKESSSSSSSSSIHCDRQ